MKIKLDERDKKILAFLSKSKKSVQAIANEMEITKQAVDYRIRRLINRGIIKGFYCDIDTKYLNDTCCAFIFLKLDSDLFYKDVLSKLEQIEGIIECHFLSSNYTMMCKASADDNNKLMDIVDELHKIDCIAEIDINISLKQSITTKFQ